MIDIPEESRRCCRSHSANRNKAYEQENQRLVDLCYDTGTKRSVFRSECSPLSPLKRRPPAILCEHPCFGGDCLLVSGLLLSSALCQVKNNVMPWRAGCLSLSFRKPFALLDWISYTQRTQVGPSSVRPFYILHFVFFLPSIIRTL